jgi:hypothetical protein
MKRFILTLALFIAPFLSFSQSTEDFSDETFSGETITTNTGLIISSSNLDWSAYTNQLDYNNVLLSPPSPYITPSSNNDFFQITLSDQSKVFSSIEFDLWLNYGGMFGSGDMGCDCKSYTSENQLIETISKGSNEVAKNFVFNSGSIKKIICNPTNVEGGNNLHVDDIVFTIAQQENNNEILLNGTVSAESNQIKNVADPTETQDVATKNYVDSNVNSFSGSYNDLTDIPVLYNQDEVDALIDALRSELGNQIDTNIDNPFSGEWSGVYDETIDEDGINSGTWLGTITNQNNFIGEYMSSESNEIDTYSGFVSPNGDASLTAGTTTDGAIFTGVMYGNEASGVFVNNTSTPSDYGTWKGTKTIPDNDYTFNEFVGTWRLISESEDGTDLYLNDCQLKSIVVVSPTLLLINEFSDSSFCGFNSCSIYSLETWDITYESGSTFVVINQTRDINFCNGEVDDTDTSLQLTVNFQIIGNRLEVSYDLPSSDGSTSFIQKEYVRI